LETFENRAKDPFFYYPLNEVVTKSCVHANSKHGPPPTSNGNASIRRNEEMKKNAGQ
jgi:hypothetical protein